MNLFFLTTELPYPPESGGRVRTLAQLRLLCSLPEVEGITLLSLSETPVSGEDLSALRALSPKLAVLPPLPHPVHLLRRPLRLIGVALRRLIHGTPYLAGKWENRALRREIVRVLGRGGFDLVYIDHLGMARYLDDVRGAAPRARVIVEEHNVESEFFEQFARECAPLLAPLARAEHAAALRFEAGVLRRADAVVAISKSDAQALARIAAGPVALVVVPQVVEPLLAARPHPAAPQLCYVGTLSWRPNAQGLDWLIEKVWPRLRSALPDVRLRIAGSGLPVHEDGALAVPARWRADGVEVLGYVEDLEPLYAGSCALVAPILGGSGVRIKLLEALRAGMPIVTTPMGAHGLGLRAGHEMLCESDPARFAEACVALCTDAGLGQRLREAGYAYLAEHHSLPIAQRAMRSALGIHTTT